jgi:hypothetical protein
MEIENTVYADRCMRETRSDMPRMVMLLEQSALEEICELCCVVEIGVVSS